MLPSCAAGEELGGAPPEQGVGTNAPRCEPDLFGGVPVAWSSCGADGDGRGLRAAGAAVGLMAMEAAKGPTASVPGAIALLCGGPAVKASFATDAQDNELSTEGNGSQTGASPAASSSGHEISGRTAVVGCAAQTSSELNISAAADTAASAARSERSLESEGAATKVASDPRRALPCSVGSRVAVAGRASCTARKELLSPSTWSSSSATRACSCRDLSSEAWSRASARRATMSSEWSRLFSASSCLQRIDSARSHLFSDWSSAQRADSARRRSLSASSSARRTVSAQSRSLSPSTSAGPGEQGSFRHGPGTSRKERDAGRPRSSR